MFDSVRGPKGLEANRYDKKESPTFNWTCISDIPFSTKRAAELVLQVLDSAYQKSPCRARASTIEKKYLEALLACSLQNLCAHNVAPITTESILILSVVYFHRLSGHGGTHDAGTHRDNEGEITNCNEDLDTLGSASSGSTISTAIAGLEASWNRSVRICSSGGTKQICAAATTECDRQPRTSCGVFSSAVSSSSIKDGDGGAKRRSKCVVWRFLLAFFFACSWLEDDPISSSSVFIRWRRIGWEDQPCTSFCSQVRNRRFVPPCFRWLLDPRAPRLLAADLVNLMKESIVLSVRLSEVTRLSAEGNDRGLTETDMQEDEDDADGNAKLAAALLGCVQRSEGVTTAACSMSATSASHRDAGPAFFSSDATPNYGFGADDEGCGVMGGDDDYDDDYDRLLQAVGRKSSAHRSGKFYKCGTSGGCFADRSDGFHDRLWAPPLSSGSGSVEGVDSGFSCEMAAMRFGVVMVAGINMANGGGTGRTNVGVGATLEITDPQVAEAPGDSDSKDALVEAEGAAVLISSRKCSLQGNDCLGGVPPGGSTRNRREGSYDSSRGSSSDWSDAAAIALQYRGDCDANKWGGASGSTISTAVCCSPCSSSRLTAEANEESDGNGSPREFQWQNSCTAADEKGGVEQGQRFSCGTVLRAGGSPLPPTRILSRFARTQETASQPAAPRLSYVTEMNTNGWWHKVSIKRKVSSTSVGSGSSECSFDLIDVI
eukprot:GHVU01193498.1.p1 GENE.GHVU01193498.1~~GHVU01193498.1.p1  ORF type:complete len:717 (+),score=52.90 GHVU01193498.1:228-2378(+)